MEKGEAPSGFPNGEFISPLENGEAYFLGINGFASFDVGLLFVLGNENGLDCYVLPNENGFAYLLPPPSENEFDCLLSPPNENGLYY